MTADEDAVIADGLHRTTPDGGAASPAIPSSARRRSSRTSRRLDSSRPPRTAISTMPRDSCRGRRTPAASTGTGAWRSAMRSRATGRRAACSAIRRRFTELQESNVHSFQRPDSSHLEVDPTRTSLNGYSTQLALSKIGGPAGSLQLEHLGEESRLRLQRRRLHAARRPAQHEQLDAVAERQTEQVSPQLPLQPESMGWLELRQRPAQLRAATSTLTPCSRTTGRPESAST